MRPFEGIRVIDITHVLAGPFAAYQLGVLGADVIKVEHPDDPDQSRGTGSDAALSLVGMGTGFLTQARVRTMGEALADLAPREPRRHPPPRGRDWRRRRLQRAARRIQVRP